MLGLELSGFLNYPLLETVKPFHPGFSAYSAMNVLLVHRPACSFPLDSSLRYTCMFNLILLSVCIHDEFILFMVVLDRVFFVRFLFDPPSSQFHNLYLTAYPNCVKFSTWLIAEASRNLIPCMSLFNEVETMREFRSIWLASRATSCANFDLLFHPSSRDQPGENFRASSITSIRDNIPPSTHATYSSTSHHKGKQQRIFELTSY